jgi:trehalose 6-phosphate phosphatase
MDALFSERGERRFAAVARPGLLCAFDFDGTLAPIVPLPDQAHLPEEIRERLGVLTRLAPVAVITGRSVADIRTRLRFEADFVVGNHGLEGVPGWEAQAAQHRALCAGWIAQLSSMLRAQLPDEGIQLEDKQYSLSVHFRLVRDPLAAARLLEEMFTGLRPQPRVVSGKFVFNLLAQDACNKGSALQELITLCDAQQTIYVGDDVTDEDVFRLRRPDVLSVRIEHHPGSTADFFLAWPSDILPLLDELVARLGAAGARNWVREGENAILLSRKES